MSRARDPAATKFTMAAVLDLAKRQVLPAVVYFLGAWYASSFLLHLSGGALWLPADWRETVKIFGVFLGLCVFGFVRARTALRELRGRKTHADESAHEAHHVARYRSAILLALLALVLLAAYVGLRALCVIQWSPPAQWLAKYEKEPLPPFVDLERGTVYLPLRHPPELAEKIAVAEAAPDNHGQLDGLSYLLTYAPDELFDWLRVDGRAALAWTTLLFLAIHLAILMTISAALGLTFAPAAALGKMVAPST